MRNKTVFILIILVGLFSYFNALKCEFVWDDYYLIIQNKIIMNFGNFGKLFISDLSDKFDYYRPFQSLVYMFEQNLYGPNPLGYHLTNVLIHIVNAVLVFIVFKAIIGNVFISLSASLLFVSAPFNTEAVTYISGMADLLLGFFFLLSFLFYVKKRFLPSLICFIFALFCRETAIAIPFIFILYDLLLRKDYFKKAKVYFAFFLWEALYIVLRLTVLNFSQKPLYFRKIYFSPEINFVQRGLAFFKSIWEYFNIAIAPVNLHMQRKMDIPRNLLNQDILISFLIIISFSYVIRKYKNEKGFLLFCLFWFIILLLPQSSFVFPLIIAEHFIYLSAIGLFLIFGFMLNKLYEINKKMAGIILAILVMYYSSLTIIQNINWRNPITFYKWTLKFAPDSHKIRYLLGSYYLEKGLFDLAIDEYKKAIDIDKNFMPAKLNMKYYEEIYQNSGLRISQIYHDIGSILSKKNYFDYAEESFLKAIEYNPKLIDSYNDLGALYLRQGKIKQAGDILNQGLKINPKFDKIYYNLGVMSAQEGNVSQAINYWKKALEINPDYKQARENIESLKRGK